MNDKPHITNTKPPQKIWLQWYGDADAGIGFGEPEGVTWCDERIYPADLCYVRSGKTNTLVEELDAARAERAAAVARAEAAEAERDALRAEVATLKSAAHIGGGDVATVLPKPINMRRGKRKKNES